MFTLKIPLTVALFIGLMLIQGCATHQGGLPSGYDPEKRLDRVLEEYNLDGSKLVNCHSRQGPGVDCRSLVRDLENLALEHPSSPRILLVTALIHFQLGRTLDSQFMLDQVLSLRAPAPEAAILRSRLAMADGNFTLVKAVIGRQLKQAPDYPGLYETEAASEYLQGRYEQSLASIRRAEMLGAPPWRSHYHRGLVYEAMNRFGSACSHYSKVLVELPDHRSARSRLRLLSDHAACQGTWSEAR